MKIKLSTIDNLYDNLYRDIYNNLKDEDKIKEKRSYIEIKYNKEYNQIIPTLNVEIDIGEGLLKETIIYDELLFPLKEKEEKKWR